MSKGPLDVILNQVPYSDRKRVRDDIQHLMEGYKSLMPQLATHGK